MIEIRKAEITELAILMDIFEQGKRIMRKNGNTKQWTGGYPTEEIIKKDIENGNSYVCLDEEWEPSPSYKEMTLPMHTSMTVHG